MRTIKEAVERIKQVGIENARVVREGDKAKIEIKTPNGWVTVLPNVNPNAAEDIMRQATNKVILG